MRKLKLQIQTTIDGFIAGPNGEMDWMEMNWDDQLKQYVTTLSDAVDCIVLGRKLAQGFIPYWSSNPQQDGADKINSTKKVVFTKTLVTTEWENTILAKGDLIEEILQLKNGDGKDIIAYGGANFVGSLIKNNLIDEYHFLVNPTSIGNGMSIFKELKTNQHLTLMKATSFDCGIVALHYEPKK